MKYKVGDKLTIKGGCESRCDSYYTYHNKGRADYIVITSVDISTYSYEVYDKSGNCLTECGCFGDEHIKGKKGFSDMGDVVSKLKDLNLTEDDRLLRKYGLVDECNNLTDEGTEVLRNLLFEKYRTDVVAQLKQIETAEAKTKKSTKVKETE